MPKPSHCFIKIASFMPQVEVVKNQVTVARRLRIRGHDGRLYPYLVVDDASPMESRSEERVLQLLRLLNPCLEKSKETARRQLLFTGSNSTERHKSWTSLGCHAALFSHHAHATRGAPHAALRDILKEIQANMVPRGMLKEWALQTFPNSTVYWTFRKMFTLQLALLGFVEFVLHLNRLNPEMLQIVQDTGQLSVANFRFDVDDATGLLDANRPVPFRLTPNISEFLTPIGVSGPLTASMIAVARCFAQPSFKVPSPILYACLVSSPSLRAGGPSTKNQQAMVRRTGHFGVALLKQQTHLPPLRRCAAVRDSSWWWGNVAATTRQSSTMGH
uniref:PI3K/PI4K catalytic domain-containing protein n=1 Tax=Eptatretus burgeri TaxID=7764 RepID=A0A8C4NLY9_EPTBU